MVGSLFRILTLASAIILTSHAWVYIGSRDRRSECQVRLSDFGNPITNVSGFSVFLQLLWDDDEYLCNANSSSYASYFSASDAADPKYHHVLDGIPFGVAVRDGGSCSLTQQIANAEALGASVLLAATPSTMFASNLPPPDTNFTTNLTVLTITSECGDMFMNQLGFDKTYDLDYNYNPYLDDYERENMLLYQVYYLYNVGTNFQANLVYPLGGILMFGLLLCFVYDPLCHAWDPTYGHRRRRRRHRIAPSTASSAAASKNLLTEEFVDGLVCDRAAQELIDNSLDPPTCSVCLDVFVLTSKVTVLPCGHSYHHDCIRAWLTQQQSKCPLCKFDLLPPNDDNNNNNNNNANANDDSRSTSRILWSTAHARLLDATQAMTQQMRRLFVESNPGGGEIHVISWPVEEDDDNNNHNNDDDDEILHELELAEVPLDDRQQQQQPHTELG